MEIEARYVIPDPRTRRALRDLRQLGGYTLAPLGVVRVVDRYLDTPEGALRRGGYGCRLRSADGSWSVTLKAAGSVRGAVTTRREWTVPLEAPSPDPANWPDDEIRALVAALHTGGPLQEVVTVAQRRRVARVCDGERVVGELSLDRLRVRGDGLDHESHMLECELGPDGLVGDLECLGEVLERGYGLLAEPRTKLQRAVELLELAARARADAARAGADAAPEALTPEQVAALYEVDLRRAHHRADSAEVLYNGLQAIHGLAPWNRALVRAAALLRDTGQALDRARPDRAGRDALLRQPLVGFGDEDRVTLAAAVYLGRGAASAGRLRRAFPDRPSKSRRREALAVAALVRMASALSCGPEGCTTVEHVAAGGDGARIALRGPHAPRDARRAASRSDLWRSLFPGRLRWEVVADAGEERPRLRRGDAMRRAGAKLLRTHLRAMRAREAGTRKGTDPEELHDMRVASRRLRATLRLFGPHLAGDLVREVAAGLRDAARVLGAVRDLDVGIAGARRYAEEHPGADGIGLRLVLEEWARRREARRGEMLAYLDGEEYARLVSDMQELIALQDECPDDDAGQPRLPEAAVPYLRVYWGTVRAYRDVIDSAPLDLLHALRIDCRRLRYTLEFLQEVLPPRAAMLIREVTRMQDHLGELHDSAVMVGTLDAILSSHPAAPADLAAYRETHLATMERLRRDVPRAWRRLNRPRVRRAMARLLAMGGRAPQPGR